MENEEAHIRSGNLNASQSASLCLLLSVAIGCFSPEPPLEPHEALAKAAQRIDRILQEDRAYREGPSETEEAQTPDDPNEVTFWYYSHPLISPLMLGGPGKLDSFKSAHLEFTLKAQFIGDWNVAIQKYTVSLAAGDMPDVGMVKRSWLARLIPSGRIIPLDAILPAEFLKDLRAPVRDTVSANGHLYAVPADGFCDVLYYNKDLIASPPATWEELRACARKIRGGLQTEEYPMGYAPFLESLWSAGGEVCTNAASSLTSSEASEALDFIISLRREKLTHPAGALDPGAGTDLFVRGKVAMTVASSELLGQMKRAPFPIGVAPVPGKTNPVSMLSDNAIVVFARYARAKQPAIASLIDFLTGPEAQGEGSAPTRESVSKLAAVDPGLDQAFQAGRNTPLVPAWGAIEFELTRYLDLAYRWEPSK